MGTEQNTLNTQRNTKNDFNFENIKLSKSLFDFLYVIGRGGFGKVWKVLLKRTSKNYALKEMSKMKIILKRSEKSIQSERELLSNLYHPFIVNMISAFQDFNNLYLVMDLFKGGDMRYHIFLNKKFSEIQSKFFISNIIIGLEYLHKNKIIHRDIKPENLVLDQNGYLAITDFGIAKRIEKSSLPDASGTPGYMAPEVLFSQIHSFSVDYYAVGVIAFEFMKGFRPYQGRDRKEIKEAILAKEICINTKQLKNEGWSLEGGDFINRMMKRKVKKRLGFYGVNEIKTHAWFREVNWDLLSKKKIKSPYIPKQGDNFDKKFCEFTNEFYKEINMKEKYNNIIKQKDYVNLFKNYTYIRPEEKDKVLNDYYYNINGIINNNKNKMDKDLKKSLSKIIHTNKKHQLRIEDNIIINDENENILNINYNNKVKLSKSKTMNHFFPSKQNNTKVFHKKRVSSKESKINSLSKYKSLSNITNNNNNINNNKDYKNNIIIINPYYNQNINYFREKESKEKIEIDYNYNTIDAKNTRINKANNNIFTYKKNLSPKLHPSSSMKIIKGNFDFQRMGDYNILNNNEKENMIYSPPHVLSPKFKSTRNNDFSKIKYGTLDYALDNNEYNTIHQFKNNNYFEAEKQMIMNKIDNRINSIDNKTNKINKSDLVYFQNKNNNYFYSTLNKFHNRLTSEKMIYSSCNSKNKIKHNHISQINTNIDQISLYNNNNQSINQIRKEKNLHTDKNNFNKSKRIKYDIESYSKRNKIYENTENNQRKKTSKKTIINYYNSKIGNGMNNYETINHERNNNIFKIKVNLIPKPYSKYSSLSNAS